MNTSKFIIQHTLYGAGIYAFLDALSIPLVAAIPLFLLLAAAVLVVFTMIEEDEKEKAIEKVLAKMKEESR